MRLITFLILVSSFQVMALDANSQAARISLNYESTSLKNILATIENETNYYFLYSSTVIDPNREISVSVENKEIDDVLDELLKGTGIKYEIKGRQILLTGNDELIGKIAQQTLGVAGKVTDASGEPLPGVTVLVKGTTTGTITDFDGNYTIADIPANGTLVFSFVGMQTQEIFVGNQSSINLKMVEDAIGIEEVVAVGFGTQKKVNLTGAVGVVDSEKLEARPVQNAGQMLQGLVSGLNISQPGGSLEDRPNINIRGTATIGEGSTGSPLVLIDGMEGDINALNPQDIDNISVLKDAAASSIYGSRAPFGVILVTTKKGAEGRTVINYNNSIRWSSPINLPNMMDSYTFALYFNDANINSGESPFFTDERLASIKDYQNHVTKDEVIQNPKNPQYWADGYEYGQANNDWYDVIYKDYSFAQEHNMSISGGTQAIQYFASGNFLDQSGLMEFNNDKFKRYTTTLKVKAKLTDWMTASISNRFIREDYGRPSQLKDNLFQDLARQGWPMLPVYDPNGYLYSSPSPALGLANGGRDISQKDWLYQQGQLTINPAAGWLITGELNYRTITVPLKSNIVL